MRKSALGEKVLKEINLGGKTRLEVLNALNHLDRTTYELLNLGALYGEMKEVQVVKRKLDKDEILQKLITVDTQKVAIKIHDIFTDFGKAEAEIEVVDNPKIEKFDIDDYDLVPRVIRTGKEVNIVTLDLVKKIEL